MLTLDEIPFGEEAAQGSKAFSDGNARDLKSWQDSLTMKAKLIVQTIEPIIEISLVKLLGNSNEYKKLASNITFIGDFDFDVTFTYSVKNWNAPGVAQEYIAQDANMIFSNLTKVQNVKKWKSCKIDVEAGTLEVRFII